MAAVFRQEDLGDEPKAWPGLSQHGGMSPWRCDQTVDFRNQWILGVPQFEQNPGDSMEARNQEKSMERQLHDGWKGDERGNITEYSCRCRQIESSGILPIMAIPRSSMTSMRTVGSKGDEPLDQWWAWSRGLHEGIQGTISTAGCVFWAAKSRLNMFYHSICWFGGWISKQGK